MFAVVSWYDPAGGIGSLVTEDGARIIFDQTVLRGGAVPKAGDRVEIELIGRAARRYVTYVGRLERSDERSP